VVPVANPPAFRLHYASLQRHINRLPYLDIYLYSREGSPDNDNSEVYPLPSTITRARVVSLTVCVCASCVVRRVSCVVCRVSCVVCRVRWCRWRRRR